jgi:hypothetical protein
MRRKLSVLLLCLFAVACSSNKDLNRELEETEHEELKPSFIVREASSKTRPGWIEDAEVWSYQNMKDQSKNNRFFSFETEPKVSRQIACDLAKASANADIASEIATFIDKQLATSTEGAAGIDENNPQIQALREFTESTLAQKTQALIHGAAPVKTYWEKREYKQTMGAKKDFVAWTCAVLVRMDSKRLATAVDEAANHVLQKADDPGTRENVKKALDKAGEDFLKAKSGQL